MFARVCGVMHVCVAPCACACMLWEWRRRRDDDTHTPTALLVLLCASISLRSSAVHVMLIYHLIQKFPVTLCPAFLRGVRNQLAARVALAAGWCVGRLVAVMWHCQRCSRGSGTEPSPGVAESPSPCRAPCSLHLSSTAPRSSGRAASLPKF